MSSLSPLKDTDNCFACGRRNDHGLRLAITTTSDGVESEFVAERRFEGWQDVVHGGIVSTVLDELLVWAGKAAGHNVVTGELTVRFRRPVEVGQKVRGVGRITGQRGRLLLGASQLLDESGGLLAEASGKLMRI